MLEEYFRTIFWKSIFELSDKNNKCFVKEVVDQKPRSGRNVLKILIETPDIVAKSLPNDLSIDPKKIIPLLTMLITIQMSEGLSYGDHVDRVCVKTFMEVTELTSLWVNLLHLMRVNLEIG